MQSVPMSQSLNSEPGPPSSHSPSTGWLHVFEQIYQSTGGGDGGG